MPCSTRVPQQLVGGVERVRHLGALGRRAAIGRRARVIDDEPAADRVVDPLGERRPDPARRSNAVNRMPLACSGSFSRRWNTSWVSGIERDSGACRAAAAAWWPPTAATRAAIAIDVDRGRLLALEAEHHRPVAAVALAGEPEAAEQLDLDARGLRELAVAVEPLGEAPRRAHRADRVRARRADPDLEDIEHGDVHVASIPTPSSEQDPSLDAGRQRGDAALDVLRDILIEVHDEIADIQVGR